MNQGFLDFVESKISTEGSYLLQHAVNEFYNKTNTNKPLLEKAASYLQGTGKYVIVKAFITGNLTIERNPNYETGQSVIETNTSVKETNTSIQALNKATTDNIPIQKKLTFANVLVSATAVIISAVALLKGDSPEVKQLQKLLIQKSQLIDSISQYHKEIDSSLKVFLERSSNKDNDKLNNIQQKPDSTK
jgi:ABC-type transport system substrate-binding protein